MRRYIWPGSLCIAAVIWLILSWNTESAWMFALAGCGLASCWWSWTAARAPAPLGRHLAAALAPGLLPVGLVVYSALAMAHTDLVIGWVILLAPVILALALPPAAAVVVLIDRIDKARQQTR